MRISLLATCIFMLAGVIYAQEDTTTVTSRSYQYFNSFLGGGLVGNAEKSYTMTLTTTHGVAINRVRCAIGTGIDGYNDWKVLPVFGSISFDWARINNNALFIQLNLGHSFAWKINNMEGTSHYREEGGLLVNPMIGYRMANGKKFTVYVAIGHKTQRMSYSYIYEWWPTSKYTVDEEFQRLVLQIGIGLH